MLCCISGLPDTLDAQIIEEGGPNGIPEFKAHTPPIILDSLGYITRPGEALQIAQEGMTVVTIDAAGNLQLNQLRQINPDGSGLVQQEDVAGVLKSAVSTHPLQDIFLVYPEREQEFLAAAFLEKKP